MRDQPSKTMRVQAGHESEASQAKQAKPSQAKTRQDKTSQAGPARHAWVRGAGSQDFCLLASGLPGVRASWRESGRQGLRQRRRDGGREGRKAAGRPAAGGKEGGWEGGREGGGRRKTSSFFRQTDDASLMPSVFLSYVFRLPEYVLRLQPSVFRESGNVFRRPSCVWKAETGRLPSSGPKSGRRKTEARPESGTQTGSQRATLFYLCGPGPWQPEHRLRRGPASQTARQQATQAS